MLVQRITLEGYDISSEYEIAPEFYLQSVPAEGEAERFANMQELAPGCYRVMPKECE